MLRKEQEALGDYFGTSLVISLVAAAGGGIARHTDRAELGKTLQDRHALELAGFDAAAVDAVVKMAGNDPQRAAELLHASWQETSVEKRRANAQAKREALEQVVAGKGAEEHSPEPDNAGDAVRLFEPAGDLPLTPLEPGVNAAKPEGAVSHPRLQRGGSTDPGFQIP